MITDSVRLSKFLSLVLRHQPETIGLTLDAQGWAPVDTLLERCAASGTLITREQLLHIVASSDKQRFTLSPDGERIRAAQGHSLAIDLALAPQAPPPVLYHGTATRFVDAILAQGLQPQSRQHVHLSSDADTARRVGQRHGKPIILVVDSAGMNVHGHSFYCADNGVWLTDAVPAGFLRLQGDTPD